MWHDTATLWAIGCLRPYKEGRCFICTQLHIHPCTQLATPSVMLSRERSFLAPGPAEPHVCELLSLARAAVNDGLLKGLQLGVHRRAQPIKELACVIGLHSTLRHLNVAEYQVVLVVEVSRRNRRLPANASVVLFCGRDVLTLWRKIERRTRSVRSQPPKRTETE